MDASQFLTPDVQTASSKGDAEIRYLEAEDPVVVIRSPRLRKIDP